MPAGGTDLGPWLALAMVDATHGWAVDVLDGQQWWLLARRTLLATSDGGLHWATFQASAPVPDLTAVQMLSSRAGLAIGFDQQCALDRARADSSACRPLLRTRDGGHTWVAAL